MSKIREELKEIPGFSGYFISNTGNVYSKKSGEIKKLSPYVDTKGCYLMIRIIDNNGKRRGKLIHRLVAEAFIPNPNNLPEVNHKDKNPQNPNVANLEWTTRRENLYESYSTMSPTRNYRKCDMYINGEKMTSFGSVAEASRYAEAEYNASRTSLSKYRRWGVIVLVVNNSIGKTVIPDHVYKTRKKSDNWKCND